MNIEFSFMYKEKRWTGLTVTPHKHSCFEVVFYLSGSGVTKIGDKEYKFNNNTVAIITPETWHEEYFDEGGDVLFLGFNYKDDDITLSDNCYDITNNIDMHRFISDMVKEIANQKPYYLKIIPHALAICITNLVRDKISGKQCWDVFYVENFIKENYSQKISFQDIAHQCGYSYDYFRYLFRSKIGVYPKRYLISQRIEASKNLLLTTDKKITDIAYLSGFSSSSQFAKMFKASENMSPIEFRKNGGKAPS